MLKTHLQTIHVIFTLPHSRKGLELFKETKVANPKFGSKKLTRL